jgi:L-methionine (R)-S-oxide reductase
MKPILNDAIAEIRSLVSSAHDRAQKAHRLAEIIRDLGNYRWVGVYDVGDELVSIVSWSGPAAPAFPTFPVTKGLTGSAIQQKSTIVVGDVRTDPRYLTTLGGTLSEIIIPILSRPNEKVIGTIDVESERENAFSRGDCEILEQCAAAARSLWAG